MESRTVFLFTCLLACVILNSASEELKAENVPASESDSTKESQNRDGKQLKWLEPAAIILNNLKETNSPSSNDIQGRFFQLIQKGGSGTSMTQMDIFFSVSKTFLEDIGDSFTNFAKKFNQFVDNEVAINLANQAALITINALITDFNTQAIALANQIAAASESTNSGLLGGIGGGLLG